MPTEWDEADLAYRIRAAGWKVATCGYERLGGYEHLGSSTLGDLSDAYKARVLKNGLLFHERWAARHRPRPRADEAHMAQANDVPGLDPGAADGRRPGGDAIVVRAPARC